MALDKFHRRLARCVARRQPIHFRLHEPRDGVERRNQRGTAHLLRRARALAEFRFLWRGPALTRRRNLSPVSRAIGKSRTAGEYPAVDKSMS